MSMDHPLNSIPMAKRLSVFLPLLVATVVLTAIFRFIGPFTPNIVDYELAGSAGKVAAIVSAWSASGQLLRASFNLGLDYLYMPVYSTTIALACVWAALVISNRGWRGLGMLLAWGLWLAAVFDATENYALITMLFGTVADPYPQIAAVCAVCKFGLIVLGLLYSAIAAVVWITERIMTASGARTR